MTGPNVSQENVTHTIIMPTSLLSTQMSIRVLYSLLESGVSIFNVIEPQNVIQWTTRFSSILCGLIMMLPGPLLGLLPIADHKQGDSAGVGSCTVPNEEGYIAMWAETHKLISTVVNVSDLDSCAFRSPRTIRNGLLSGVNAPLTEISRTPTIRFFYLYTCFEQVLTL